MKKSGIILFFVFMYRCVSAQYCGSPDTLGCNLLAVPDSVGLYPAPDSFPPLLNNFLTAATIQFRNFDTLLFGSQVLPVYSLTWDTIENLPPGLCWSTDKANNTYGRGEAGCIHIRGLACGPTGQYKLSTLVTVDIGIPVETAGDPGGLGYLVRLENPGDAVVPLDGAQTDSMPFIPYGGICQNLAPLTVSLGGDQTVCQGSVVTFNPVVSGGQPPYTYQWQYTGSSIVCPSCVNASSTVTVNSTYILVATDAGGEYGSDTVQYTVTGSAYNFQISAPEPSTFCGGGTVTITGHAIDSVGLQWYNGSSLLSGDTNSVLTVSDVSGTYYLVYTEAGVCQATSNVISLVFYDTTAVTITSLNSDTFCVGGATTLVANAIGTGLSYAWMANDSNLNYTNAALSANSAGYYRVIVTNGAGCRDTSLGVLLVASPNLPPIVAYTQFSNDTVCNNASEIVLTGGQPTGGYYSGSGVTDTLFNPFAATVGPNFIYYSYTDSTGCGNFAFDTIDVLLCTDISDISDATTAKIFPNPVSDEVTIQSGLLALSGVSVSLYNIAGQLIPVTYLRRGTEQISLNTSALPAGWYWVQLIAKGLVGGNKFIKTD